CEALHNACEALHNACEALHNACEALRNACEAVHGERARVQERPGPLPAAPQARRQSAIPAHRDGG
ncbi:MAG: hypothetical protein KJZ65_04790, partial [Phycisphaerales bacterium]|nr:hypothetical protein [Phycisphaerales bacterium]